MMGEYERVVLSWLAECKALTIEQVEVACRTAAGERNVAVYKLVERLERKGWVKVRQAEWDKRERYVVLTKDGFAVAEAVDVVRKGGVGEYKPLARERAWQAVRSAWFLIEMVRNGFPKERLVRRAEALAALKLRPQDAPMLIYTVDETPQRKWAVHLLWKRRYHEPLEREIALIPATKATFHIVLYDNALTCARDRRRYAEKALWSGLHLFTPETLRRWAAWVAKSPTVEADIVPLLRMAQLSAPVRPAPEDSPGVCILEQKRPVLVVDMRFERVGAAAAVIRAAKASFRTVSWDRVIFAFASVAQLRWWALRLGDWAWAVVEDRPGLLCRIVNRRPVVVRRPATAEAAYGGMSSFPGKQHR